jgi:hypothetical protein
VALADTYGKTVGVFHTAKQLLTLFGDSEHKDLEALLADAVRVAADLKVCQGVELSTLTALQACEVLKRLAAGGPKDILRNQLKQDTIQAVEAMNKNSAALETIAMGDLAPKVNTILLMLNEVLVDGKLDVDIESIEFWQKVENLKRKVDETNILPYLIDMGRACGKQLLVDQAGCLSSLLHILEPMARVITCFVLASSKEEQCISIEKVKDVSAMRRSLGNMAALAKSMDFNVMFSADAGYLGVALDPATVPTLQEFANEMASDICKVCHDHSLSGHKGSRRLAHGRPKAHPGVTETGLGGRGRASRSLGTRWMNGRAGLGVGSQSP